MKIGRILFVLTLIAACSSLSEAQTATRKPAAPPVVANQNAPARYTAAYAELLLRRTELESNLEDLLVTYLEEFPKVKETRFEMGLIEKELARLLALPAADAPKMTLALGKLLVRRAELQTNLWLARTQFGEEHPNVQRAKRRADSFDRAVKEILP